MVEAAARRGAAARRAAGGLADRDRIGGRHCRAVRRVASDDRVARAEIRDHADRDGRRAGDRRDSVADRGAGNLDGDFRRRVRTRNPERAAYRGAGRARFRARRRIARDRHRARVPGQRGGRRVRGARDGAERRADRVRRADPAAGAVALDLSGGTRRPRARLSVSLMAACAAPAGRAPAAHVSLPLSGEFRNRHGHSCDDRLTLHRRRRRTPTPVACVPAFDPHPTIDKENRR
ncbi:hypothetical protein EMIT0158MI4_150113 [Burkholderia ambifaria]